MTQPEAVYSAKQVASELKISSGMLRRYALAYEAITKDVIKQHPRDGRQYSANQLGTLQRAKAFVTGNPGMSVDQALKLAMGATEADVIVQPARIDLGDNESLAVALEGVVAPLVSEIRALRKSNERLTAALEAKELEQVIQNKDQSQENGQDFTTGSMTSDVEDGPIVRLARRFERLLIRRSRR